MLFIQNFKLYILLWFKSHQLKMLFFIHNINIWHQIVFHPDFNSWIDFLFVFSFIDEMTFKNLYS